MCNREGLGLGDVLMYWRQKWYIVYKFLRDQVQFIERNIFNGIEGGGISDHCNIESVSDRGGQQTGI